MTSGARMLHVLVALVAGGLSVATAQDQPLEVATRGPRFLVASTAAAPLKPVRPEAIAVLQRRIAVDLDGVTLEQALTTISRQGRLELVYSRSVLALDTPVRLRANDISVAAALTVVLLDTGIDVLLRPDGQVVLVRRGGALRYNRGAITGRVTDAATGHPLLGADVSLKGTTFKTTTADSGGYRLRFDSVPSGKYTVSVRLLGYRPAERNVEIVDTEGTIQLDVALRPAPARLQELVTTATGQQRRRDLGNDITTIHADSVLRTAPIRSLTDLLTNRVPGMTVQHTSGAPGDPARIRLRGIKSVAQGNDPVFIVDGVRIYSTQSEPRSGNLTNLVGLRGHTGNTPAPSPIDQLDPNLIEKIEVFKGPSAATLYGADAANGVVVITTKRGKPGPTRWDASFTQSRTETPGQFPEGYYRFGRDFFSDAFDAPRFCTLADPLCVADSLVRFQALNDPATTLLGRGRRTGVSLTSSGGSQSLTYSITGSYNTELGLLRLPDFEIERFRTTFNREPPDWMRRPHHYTDWSVASSVRALLGSRADVTLRTQLSRSEQQRTSLENQVGSMLGTYLDKVNDIYMRPLNIDDPVGASGSPGLQQVNPLVDYYRRTTAVTTTFTTSLNANWRPRTWFSADGTAGLNVVPREDETLLPSGLVAPTDSGALSRGAGRSLTSTLNLHGAIRKPLKWGFVFQTNVGADLTTTSTADLVTAANNLIPGTTSLAGATGLSSYDNRLSTSVFGWHIEPQITGQRLSLSTGIRLDGGSTNGTRLTRTGGGLFGGLLGLPKLNGTWVISEEPFFPFKALFSSLRLRGAYGQSQVQPNVRDHLRLYTPGLDGADPSLTLTTLGNTALRPERSTEFEGGFDADLLESRLSVELTGYRDMQVDALMPLGVPVSVNGGGTVLTNIGNIRNTGMELRVLVTPIRTPRLTWGLQLNYARNNNVLTKLGTGVLPNPTAGIVEGYPVNGRWSLPIMGYADQNGDGVLQRGEIQVGDSMVYMGRLLPQQTTGFNTNVGLFGGAVTITANFSYQSGATQIDQTAKRNWVLSRALVDPTVSLREQAAVLAVDSTDYGLTQDVSTFRFMDMSVGYNAPARVARLLGARRLAVALTGSNLGLHSTYRGKDPDVSAWSPTEHIVDTGQLPLPRTWQLRLDIGY